MDMLLEKNELLDLGNKLQQVSICCQEGYCWLTVESDNHDHILSAGNSHTIRQSGRVVLTALTRTRLQLVRGREKTFVVPVLKPCSDNC